MTSETISTDELLWLRQCAFAVHYGPDALERESKVPFRSEPAYLIRAQYTVKTGQP